MSNQAIITMKDEPQSAAVVTPLAMLNAALERGADVVTMEKLMALHERWEASQARKAFDAAIAEAKAEIEPVVRNATGHNNKRYADFAAIARAVDPIISRHGLSYRFRTNQTDRISVTCILSHRDGHSEETTLSGPPDASGSKNAIQAIGSTLTYLQRYSLVQALGLAAANDDDGRSAGKVDVERAAPESVQALRDKIKEVGLDEDRVSERFGVPTLDDLPADKWPQAMRQTCDWGKKLAEKRAADSREQAHG